MLGAQLRHLAIVSLLAKNDFETAPITIYSDTERVQASYRGTYSAGVCAVDVPLKAFAVAVNAIQFNTLASLFKPDADVKVQYSKKSLRLATKDKSVSLKAISEDVEDDILIMEDAPVDFLCSAIVNVKDLISELAIAAEFTSKSMALQVLTGIRLVFDGSGLLIIATNGFSVVYKSQYIASCTGRGATVITPLDVIMGLKLCNKEATIGIQKNERFIVQSASSYFYVSTLMGNWPDLERIMSSYERVQVTVPVSTIKDLFGSAAALQASTDLQLVGSEKNGIFMRTVSSEAGSAAISISNDKLGGVYNYDGESLMLATKLGDPLLVYVPPISYDTDKLPVPTLINSGSRNCWVTYKVR